MLMAGLRQARRPASNFSYLRKGNCEAIYTVMQSENPFIADFAKLMNSAAGTLAGVTREARDSARERFKEAMGGLDFVSREEFDAVKAMAATARDENEALKTRLDALEAALNAQARGTG
jgi:BMFP domain-containing protein YqiC